LSYGFGSALGKGLGVMLHALPPAAVEGSAAGAVDFRVVPNEEVPKEQAMASLRALLNQILSGFRDYQPNNAEHHLTARHYQLAAVLNAFPSWDLRCEGHAKGKPEENNTQKVQLSVGRAEGMRTSLKKLGVTNAIYCVGRGSEEGLGMTVRMFLLDPDEKLPDTTGLSDDEQLVLLDKLLSDVLQYSIDFTPNKPDIPESAQGLLKRIAKILSAFPSQIALRCEGHVRGAPEEDGPSKRKLSKARAVAFCNALQKHGVMNVITCEGAGCAQSLGPRVLMRSLRPEELAAQILDVPDGAAVPEDDRIKSMDSLLAQALEKDGPINFAANSYEVPGSARGIVANLLRVLQAFPEQPVCCEGHTKGQAEKDDEAKRKLCLLRAEALKASLRKGGAKNQIHCVGRGCELGLGMCMKMFVMAPGELEKTRVPIPDSTGLSLEEKAKLLDKVLADILEAGIKFQPNSSMELHVMSSSALEKAASVLKAFPDIAVKCIGHAKGKADENSDAKVKLSLARAGTVRSALSAEGVSNELICIGEGCSRGIGVCVKLEAKI